MTGASTTTAGSTKEGYEAAGCATVSGATTTTGGLAACHNWVKSMKDPDYAAASILSR